MVNIADIKSDRWSTSIMNFGEIVADIEDLKQCLYVILGTRKKSAPGWADFGCGIFDHIDKPVNVASPLIVRDIRAAIERWEPDIIIQDITYVIEDVSTVKFTIIWRASETIKPTDPLSTTFTLSDGKFYVTDDFGIYLLTEFGLIVL